MARRQNPDKLSAYEAPWSAARRIHRLKPLREQWRIDTLRKAIGLLARDLVDSTACTDEKRIGMLKEAIWRGHEAEKSLYWSVVYGDIALKDAQPVSERLQLVKRWLFVSANANSAAARRCRLTEENQETSFAGSVWKIMKTLPFAIVESPSGFPASRTDDSEAAFERTHDAEIVLYRAVDAGEMALEEGRPLLARLQKLKARLFVSADTKNAGAL